MTEESPKNTSEWVCTTDAREVARMTPILRVGNQRQVPATINPSTASRPTSTPPEENKEGL